MELKVEYVNIDSIEPYKNNARNHGDKDVQAIKRSIEEFGFNDPIGIWNNQIVEGHGRLLAAKELGMKTVPVIRLDEMTDEQRKAYALAHNKTAELSEWDFDTLASELQDISTIDMSEFGFDIPELEEVGAEIIEDEAPDVPEEARAKLGDMYQLGEHRLICGDCTDINVLDTLMGGVKADLVFTDPPYNIASDSKNFASDCSKAMNRLSEAEWDKDFRIEDALNSIYEIMSQDLTVYICTSHFLAERIWAWMRQWADHYSYCIWNKPNPMPSLAKRHWTWNTEIICYATRGKHTFNFPESGHALSTWTINKKNGKTGHPTEKPVEVPAMAISHSSKEGDIVLDVFGGSGSTLIACEQLGRKCYMCELDPHYVDVIIERWERFTGLKAELIEA